MVLAFVGGNTLDMQKGDRFDERRWGRLAVLRSGQLLRELRELRQMSPKDLCTRINMTQAQLSDIERGIQPLSLRRARQMSVVLEAPFDEIVAELLKEKLADAGFDELSVLVTANKHGV